MIQSTITKSLTTNTLLDIQERIFGESFPEQVKKVVFERGLRTAQKIGFGGMIKGGDRIIDNLDACNIGFNFFQCLNESCETNSKKLWVDKFRFIPFSCNSRYCPSCIEKMALKSVIAYRPYVETFKNFYMLTLTYKNFESITKDFVVLSKDHRKNFFKNLKRKFGFDVQNSIYAFEVTQSYERGFHYHIHILLEVANDPYDLVGMFELVYKRDGNTKKHPFSVEWFNLTGDSFIVGFTPIKGGVKDALNYVLHYLKKQKFEDPGAYVDFVQAFEGRQLIRPSKTYKKSKFKLLCDYCADPLKFAGFVNEISIPAYPEEDADNLVITEESVGFLVPESSLLDKISKFLDLPYNASDVEVNLTESELAYLLRSGEIFESRRGEYRRP